MERKGWIQVVMHRQSTPADVLQSFIHALVVANLTEETKYFHAESCQWMSIYYPVFIDKVSSSFLFNPPLLSLSLSSSLFLSLSVRIGECRRGSGP